ncbi:biosynthetic-type acetolactate synthase large subunit [Candidatus Magnetaquicoccus inordinatus]|uniref:biosynthetic-type acetolactate synthase large subunit n=1 Tax=Candidatus Magnetaquicoccus inordinatus TaxID=2496818 RepID=UPI00102BF1A4|nr:biosynthetic-type acetolactate synthase large subunit [Candidatus Magnetaquicoccus inordinatus]
MQLTGAEIVVKCLLEQGVRTVFGYPGGAALYIYDEIHKAGDKLSHILSRHEQGALHAADGYARATGAVGVALVTSGPGATNAVTGLATAYMDSIPLVCISAQVPVPLIGNDAFQEVDTVGITRSCTKHNYLVRDVRDLARVLREAFYIAKSGRPGPVLVDIPKDVSNTKTEYTPANGEVNIRSYRPTMKGHPRQVRRAVEMLQAAQRPLLYTGGGVILANAWEELRWLTLALDLPITHTLMGLGAFPANDRHFLGMLGMHGTYEANLAVSNCDLLVAVGARFDDRVTGKISAFAPHAKIIHIDVDPTSISKNVRVDLPIVGDVRLVLEQINAVIREEQTEQKQIDRQAWWQMIEEWRKKECLRYNQGPEIIESQYVIESLCSLTDGQAIIATDVGQHQMWAAQFYGFQQARNWLTSGGLGTMGYGLPAAMGAQVAFPERQVVVITGDGSIQMNIQELGTCLQYQLPVKIIILNNGFLGMVRQWQELFYERRYAQTDIAVAPDFVKLAEAYGALGLKCNRPEDVLPTLRQGLAHPGTVLMDFQVQRESNVYPMVPAGGALQDMILGELL